MTLWCIARSPLIMGGNMPKNDDFTLALLTNDEVLAVNQNSMNNRQLFNTNNTVAWIADMPKSKNRIVYLSPRQLSAGIWNAGLSGSKTKYLALFNTTPAPVPRGRRGDPAASAATSAPAPDALQPKSVSVSLADSGFHRAARVRDLLEPQGPRRVSRHVHPGKSIRAARAFTRFNQRIEF